MQHFSLICKLPEHIKSLTQYFTEQDQIGTGSVDVYRRIGHVIS